jgi:hypothetical protein
MSLITQYDILAAMVNDKIAEGWQPFGDPFVLSGHVGQAVVLTAKAEKRIRKNSEG